MEVRAERVAPTGVRLRWRLQGEDGPCQVAVYRLAAPDAEPCGRPALRTRAAECLVEGLDPERRCYFGLVAEALPPLVCAERRLPFAGASNFRDLGGYATAQGRTVRWGLVYRAGELSRLTDGDRRLFADLDLALIIDLRSDPERVRAPSALDPSAAARTVSIPVDPGSARSHRERLLRGEADPGEAERAMRAIYREFATRHRADFGALLRRVAEARGPVLLHCAAGKDRTGFAAALLLFALGVAPGVVMEDYLLSRDAFDAERALRAEQRHCEASGAPPFDPGWLRPWVETRREYLESALAAVEGSAGAMETYLQRELGLPSALIAGLRERLTV